LRLVSWNCGSGFHHKVGALSALAPDIAVIQECANLATLVRKSPEFAPRGALWVGDNPNRGLGVFSFGRYRLAQADTGATAITYALPAHVIGPSTFNLVALWSHYGRTPIRVGALGPTLLALRAYAGLLVEQPSIVAGDLNNHVRWDKPGKASNHANAVIASAALGLVSAYHAFHELAQGAERHPTLYWRDRTRTGPTFHIDYVFVPKSATSQLRRVSVGSRAKWIATGLSDHAPLIVDFLPEFASTTKRMVNRLRKARGASPPPNDGRENRAIIRRERRRARCQARVCDLQQLLSEFRDHERDQHGCDAEQG
jgi:exodeoxyribonuclease III